MHKLIISELRELLHNKFIIAGIFLLLLFHIGILGAAAYDGSFSGESYKVIKEYLNEEYDNDSERIEWIHDKYNQLTEDGRVMVTDENPDEETVLIALLEAESRQVSEYDKYIETIRSNADKSSNISIFSSKDGYSERNIKKTDSDYASVQNTKLKFLGSAGFVRLLGLKTQNILLYTMMIILVMQVVLEDKRCNIDKLYSATKNGQAVRAFSKSTAIFVYSCVIVTVLLITTIVFGIAIYGRIDWTASIQSLYGYEGSTMHMSVIEYIGCLLLFRFLAVFSVCMMFCCVAILLNNVVLYIFFTIVVYVCTFPMSAIAEQSPFMVLKYTNISYQLYGVGLFRDYINLDIFRHPCSHIVVNIVALSFFALLFEIIFLLCFAKIPRPVQNLQYFIHTKCRTLYNITLGRLSKFISECNSKRRKHIIVFELNKLLIGRKIGIVILVCLITLFYIAAHKSEKMNLNNMYYKLYMHRYEGELTDAKLDSLENESKRLDSCISGMSVLTYKYQKNLMTEMEYSLAFDEHESAALGNTAFRKVETNLQYLISYGKKNQRLPYLVYDNGWKLLLGIGEEGKSESILCLLAATLCVIVTTAGIYSIEYETGMNSLIRTCVYGRKRLRFVKSCVGFILTAMSGIIIYAPLIYYYQKEYGLNAVLAPAASIQELTSVPYSITILDCVIGIFILRFIFLSIISFIIMYISEKTENTIKTLCIGLIAIIIPLVSISVI